MGKRSPPNALKCKKPLLKEPKKGKIIQEVRALVLRQENIKSKPRIFP